MEPLTRTVNVTQAHINASLEILNNKPRGYDWCALCPIANAIKDALNCPEIYVGLTFARLNNKYETKEGRIELPSFVSTWIKKFDATKSGEPFNFEIEVPKNAD